MLVVRGHASYALRMNPTHSTLLLLALLAAATGCQSAKNVGSSANLRRALLLHASFDQGLDADFAAGDPKLYRRFTS